MIEIKKKIKDAILDFNNGNLTKVSLTFLKPFDTQPIGKIRSGKRPNCSRILSLKIAIVEGKDE